MCSVACMQCDLNAAPGPWLQGYVITVHVQCDLNSAPSWVQGYVTSMFSVTGVQHLGTSLCNVHVQCDFNAAPGYKAM